MTLERNHWWASMTDEDKAKAMERDLAAEAGCAHTASGETRERMEIIADALTTPADPKQCEDCGGTGYRRVHSHEDYGVSFESETCDSCDYGRLLLHVDALNEEVQDAEAERDRYREALEALIESCADWSNDDIRDHCRSVLDV